MRELNFDEVELVSGGDARLDYAIEQGLNDAGKTFVFVVGGAFAFGFVAGGFPVAVATAGASIPPALITATGVGLASAAWSYATYSTSLGPDQSHGTTARVGLSQHGSGSSGNGIFAVFGAGAPADPAAGYSHLHRHTNAR